jgi:transcriptional regulator NrdR family protein
MHCPNCDAPAHRGANRVVQARNDTIESKIRQRKCLSCDHKWWTVEVELPVGCIKWVREDDPDSKSFSLPRRMPGALRVVFQ